MNNNEKWAINVIQNIFILTAIYSISIHLFDVNDNERKKLIDEFIKMADFGLHCK